MTQNTFDTATPFTFDQASMQSPHSVYRAMRAGTPVPRAVLPSGLKVWLVTRYEDVRAALADPRLSKDVDKARTALAAQAPEGGEGAAAEVVLKHMLNTDPPDHTRLRRLLGKAFTTSRVERIAPRVKQIADEMLDDIAALDQVDLIERYAFPLPLTVICELFGVPEQDRLDLHRWSGAMVTDSASIALTPGAQDEHTRAARQAAAQLAGYLAELVARKRAEPADDLMSALVQVHDSDGGLSAGELVSMANLTLVAGHETVTNLIGNAVATLLAHPGQLEAVRADPELLPVTLEEVLRFEGPANSALIRHTLEPVEYSGVTIPAGEFVLAMLTSANRDESRFADADRFDPGRATSGLLTFGHGIHYCIGAPLARLEGRIALDRLLRRFPELRLAVAPDELRWRFSTLIRGLDSLPVVLR